MCVEALEIGPADFQEAHQHLQREDHCKAHIRGQEEAFHTRPVILGLGLVARVAQFLSAQTAPESSSEQHNRCESHGIGAAKPS